MIDPSTDGPRDFGFNARETLAFVLDSTPPPGFTQYWSRWRDIVWSKPATLSPATSEAHTRHGATHVVASLGDVQVGCRVSGAAPGSARGVVITSHGYGPPDTPMDDRDPWTSRDGMAVIKVRLRGFPGSDVETGDLTAAPYGHICTGLEGDDPMLTWAVSGSVADLLNVFRAARLLYGREIPISIHGESYGGGIGVVAASQIFGDDHVHRLALGVPTLGGWRWRLEQRVTAGAGWDMARFIESHPALRERTTELLALFDAVVHARRVVCPVLCKLALRDEVVPAPTAAAVFNALGSDPGRKWRFVTDYGHFDGGMDDLRRHVEFERLIGEFLDPARRARDIMRKYTGG
ncbi:MAG: acetylxylan esterase [Phycisphaerales bacterium]|nr:acetylxylan esterase [Phycisphaerales bacterium]